MSMTSCCNNAGPALCLLPLAAAPSALGPAAAAACLTGAVASAALCYAGFHPYILVRRAVRAPLHFIHFFLLFEPGSCLGCVDGCPHDLAKNAVLFTGS